MSRYLLVICVVFVVFISWQSSRVFSPAEIKIVTLAGRDVVVGVATTQEQRALGLSGRKFLPENEGMLFVFDKPAKYSFWMKEMNFPIDIIWIDKDYKVVLIEENVLPESYPKNFIPMTDAMYVLETSAGFSVKNNLKIGDEVRFTY